MPVFDPKPTAPPAETPHPPRITRPGYAGVTVDTRYIPSSALLTHVQGSSMQVQYYSQVLNDDMELDGQNVTRAASLQPYRLIKNMELKVTSPLTFQQVDTNRAVGLTGTANIYPFLKPNQGDMFLTDIGDGREGIFRIKTTEQKSIFKDTCFEVTYEFVDFSDSEQGQLRLADFKAKTVVTYVYMKEFLQYGQNPVLIEEDAFTVEDLEYNYADIVKQWFREFTSREYSTLMVPGQLYSTYDAFLTQAVMKMFEINAAPQMQSIRVQNIDGIDDMQQQTVWDLCLTRNTRLLRTIVRKTKLISTKIFESDPMMEGIHHSGIQFTVYPWRNELSWDDVLRRKPIAAVSGVLTDVPSPQGRLEDFIEDGELAGLPYEGRPLINQVLADDYYIFTEAFYNNEPTQMSRFEAALRDFLDRKPVHLGLLKFLCNTYQTWGGLERFYYTPFLLMLIRGTIRRF